jgi:signal peptidase I
MPPPHEDSTERQPRPFYKGVLEWLFAIGLAVLLFFVVRNFLFRVAHVTGHSMEPSLNHGDMLILNRFSYLFSDPRLGDIVAFPYPEDPSEYHIKRIVGLPGDVIDLRDSRFFVNGEPLDDAFSHEPVLALGDMVFPITVEEGHYFVLGDNRNGSKDSRFSAVGTIPKRELVGRVLVRFWPFNNLGRVD